MAIIVQKSNKTTGNIMVEPSTRQRLPRFRRRTSSEESKSSNDLTEIMSEIDWSRRSGYITDLRPAIRIGRAPIGMTNQIKKTVNFGSIHIREHELILDYNPAVSCGPAVGLGWESIDLPTYDLEDFESLRGPRRMKTEFQLPRFMREELLREFGYSRGELAEASKIIDAARKKRRQSIAAQGVEFTQIAMEWSSRRINRLTGRRSSYQIEAAMLWQNAQRTGLPCPVRERLLP